MIPNKIYSLQDWPVLSRISAITSDQKQLHADAVILLYETASEKDWSDMDLHEREFAEAILACQHRKSAPPSAPFEMICPKCSEVVKSWHSSSIDVPLGEKRGLVFCSCGHVGVDSSDRPGTGRVLYAGKRKL